MSVTAPAGFVAAGLACGIKASGAPDLALVATDDGAAGAGRRRVHHQPGRGRPGAGEPGPPGGHRRDGPRP